jgi:hypothetical protein
MRVLLRIWQKYRKNKPLAAIKELQGHEFVMSSVFSGGGASSWHSHPRRSQVLGTGCTDRCDCGSGHADSRYDAAEACDSFEVLALRSYCHGILEYQGLNGPHEVYEFHSRCWEESPCYCSGHCAQYGRCNAHWGEFRSLQLEYELPLEES